MNFLTGLRALAVAALALVTLAAGTADRAEAIMISGSFGLSGSGLPVSGPGQSLLTRDNFTPVIGWTVSDVNGFGDYGPISFGTNFGTDTLDLSALGGFSLTNATFGSFAATSGVVLSRVANFVDVFLLGTYSPGPGLNALLQATDTSLRISINQSGQSVSAAITLNTPPVPLQVPAPASLALFGAALASLGFARRRVS